MKWTIFGGMLIAFGICTVSARQASAIELWGHKNQGCNSCGSATVSDCGSCKSRCGKCGFLDRLKNRCGGCKSHCGSCRSGCGRCKSKCGGCGLFGKCGGGCKSRCGSCGSCGCGGGLLGKLFHKDRGCKSCNTGCATCGTYGSAGAIVPAPHGDSNGYHGEDDGDSPPEPAPMDDQPQASRSVPSYSSQSLPYRIIRNDR